MGGYRVLSVLVVGFVLLLAAAATATAADYPEAKSTLPLAFDQGSGDGDGTFSPEEDCLTYPSEDSDGQRICTGQVLSFDGTVLDVDLTLPDTERGGRDGHPLMVMLHGYGGNKREWESTTNEGDGADKWHWNSHWFAEQHGYYVLTYTARGFHTDVIPVPPQPPCTRPPAAPVFAAPHEPCTPGGSSDVKIDAESAIRLKHRDREIRDTQWLSALAAELPEEELPEGVEPLPKLDRNKVGVSGGSYGGGESWTQASQAKWTFPAECSNPGPDATRPPGCNPDPSFKETLDRLKLQVAVPKYGWTDLGYSLAPNGHPGPYSSPRREDGGEQASSEAEKCDTAADQTEAARAPGDDPCYSSSTGHPESPTGHGNPLGVLRSSYVNVFYHRGRHRSNFPNYHPLEAEAWYAAFWPPAPGEPYTTSIHEHARKGLTEKRSSYYQDKQWKRQCKYDEATKRCGEGRKVAIFGIEGWTDDLFTAVEAFRQFKYLKDLDPRWPVELHLGDVGHPRAQNRPLTWRRINGQAWRFLQEHIGGSHDQQTTVTSEPTVCDNAGAPGSGNPLPHDPAQRLSATTPEGLSNGRVAITYKSQTPTTLNSEVQPDPNGPVTDPVANYAAEAISDRFSIVPGRDCPTPAGPASYTGQSDPLKESHFYVGLGSVTVPYTSLVSIPGAQENQLDARVWDVPPGPTENQAGSPKCQDEPTPEGCPVLITRGTYRLKIPPNTPSGKPLQVPLFGNHYKLRPGHSLRLDLTMLDEPYLRKSDPDQATTITFGNPTLTLPTRDSGEASLEGKRTFPPDSD